MLAHVVAGDLAQARRPGAGQRPPARRGARGSPPSSAEAIPRQHQARLRFSPSRWAILPSLRSDTNAGSNRVAGCRSAQAAAGSARASRGTRPALEHPPHALRLDQRRRQEVVARRLPGLAVGVGRRTSRRARAAISRSSASSPAPSRAYSSASAQGEGGVEVGPGPDRIGQLGQVAHEPVGEGLGQPAQRRGPAVRVVGLVPVELGLQHQQPRPAVGPLERRPPAAATDRPARAATFSGVRCASNSSRHLAAAAHRPGTAAGSAPAASSRARTSASRSCRRRSGAARAAPRVLRPVQHVIELVRILARDVARARCGRSARARSSVRRGHLRTGTPAAPSARCWRRAGAARWGSGRGSPRSAASCGRAGRAGSRAPR